MKTRVTLANSRRFNAHDLRRAAGITEMIEEVVNSEDFAARVSGATFLDTSWENASGQVKMNLTNQEILSAIRGGAESGTPRDGVISLSVQLYRSPALVSSVIGYSDEGWIYTRKRWFRTNSDEAVAGHWMHEWCHVAGFRHDFGRTSRRSASVPYVVGEIVADLLD